MLGDLIYEGKGKTRGKMQTGIDADGGQAKDQLEEMSSLLTCPLMVLLGSIIYVITNIYGNKLLKVLTEIDRAYYDGVVTLSLMKVFLTSRAAKVKQNLTLDELESLCVYMELLVGGIYCSLEGKHIGSISRIPIDRLRKSLESSSPIDSTFVNELCIARRKDIELGDVPSIGSILDLGADFPEIVEKLFISRFYIKCNALFATQPKRLRS